MKAIPRVLSLAVAAAVVFLTTGCQTVSTTCRQEIGVPRFPPTDPAQVQILRTQPTRKHIRIGEVRAEPSSENVDVTKIEAALRKAAAKIGADAAVVVYDRTQPVGAMVVGGFLNRSIETIEGRVVVAVAIKYQ